MRGAARATALVAVVASSACYATLAVLTRLAYRAGMQPMSLLAWRFILACALMTAVQCVRRMGDLRVPLADVGRFVVLALVGYGAGSVCFFLALRHADASVVAVLLYTYPALVAVIDRIFAGVPLGPWRIAALVMTFAGCALAVGAGSSGVRTDVLGILFGLGSGLGYAVFSVLLHRWLPGRQRTVIMAYLFGVAGIAFAVAALVSGGTMSTSGWSSQAWTILALVVLLPTFLAVLLYLGGMRTLGAAQAALVSSLEPLFTIALAAVLLGERMSPDRWVGVALVVAGVVIAEWRAAPGNVEIAAGL